MSKPKFLAKSSPSPSIQFTSASAPAVFNLTSFTPAPFASTNGAASLTARTEYVLIIESSLSSKISRFTPFFSSFAASTAAVVVVLLPHATNPSTITSTVIIAQIFFFNIVPPKIFL